MLGGPADFVVAFASADHAEGWDSLPGALAENLQTDAIIGCSGAGVIGTAQEIEGGPALSVWAAQWPNVQLDAFHLELRRTDEGGAIVGWPDPLIEQWPDNATLLLLAEPFSFPADFLLEQLSDEHPQTPVVGGMASGATKPGDNRLFFGRQSLSSGAVGCLLRGPVSVNSLVSQGCRPIGQKLVVTQAERNMIHSLGGIPALEQLQKVYRELPTREQELVQRGLHIGRVVSEYQDDFEMGDFLVRNVLGVDHETGIIAVGDFIRAGQTVQFHLREEQAASSELEQLLADHAKDHVPQSALLFTCNGRGSHLFSEPHHDAAMIAQHFGDIPLAGFFAQGEIGPIGGVSFLHGFTASVALFG